MARSRKPKEPPIELNPGPLSSSEALRYSARFGNLEKEKSDLNADVKTLKDEMKRKRIHPRLFYFMHRIKMKYPPAQASAQFDLIKLYGDLLGLGDTLFNQPEAEAPKASSNGHGDDPKPNSEPEPKPEAEAARADKPEERVVNMFGRGRRGAARGRKAGSSQSTTTTH